MKWVIAGVVAAGLLGATPASAQKIDLSTIKCKEFLASGKDTIAQVLMWMTGFYADQDASPVIDFGVMEQRGAKLGEYCGKNPDDGLITAAEEVFQE